MNLSGIAPAGPEELIPNVPYMGDGSLLTRAQDVWVSGDLLTPFHVPNTGPPVGGTQRGVNGPQKSPTRNEFVYAASHLDGGWYAEIRLSRTDGTSQSVLDTLTQADGETYKLEYFFPSWHPDGEHIIYCGGEHSASFESGEQPIFRINRDGAGKTTLFTSATNSGSLHHPQYSPSGDWIMFVRRYSTGGYCQIWTMAADGSGAASIKQINYNLNCVQQCIPAWQNNADVIGFQDIFNGLWKTINPDGTGETTFWTDPDIGTFSDVVYGGHGRWAWLPDDSGMLTRMRTDGTTLFDYSAAKAAVIPVDGSGGYLISPEREIYGGSINTQKYNPGYHQQRIYLTQQNAVLGGQNSDVISVQADGSDFRLDHDVNIYSALFRGFEYVGQ